MKRIFLIVSLLAVLLFSVEVVSLLQLRASLQTYARYWQQRGSTGQLTYVALGDSAAQGIGASRPERGYVGLFAERLARESGKKIKVVNLSVSGAKLSDVIDKQLPQLHRYKPDIVTIEAGANDIVHFNEEQFAIDFTSLAAQLPTQTLVANMPYFGGRLERDTSVATANKIVVSQTTANGLTMADLYTATRQGESPFNYAADFFHPNDRGYRNWAEAFWLAQHRD